MDPQPKTKTVDIRRHARQCRECGQRFSGDARFCPFDGLKLDPTTYDPLGDPLLGSTIDGRYEVVDVLGEGGTGRVYKVRHTTLNRLFAMKLLRRDLARDEELTGRFIQEAKATARVQHPNVVQITDFGKLADGVLFLVTELLVGRTLGDVIRNDGAIELVRAAQIVGQIAGGLGAAHAAGIVHRDLKPDNVFLVERAQSGMPSDGLAAPPDDVRVVDFGAAKLIGASRLTQDGIVFGTPHYMSPEQASGQPVDHRADIYALGVIMYEMFTGRVPFEADTYMGVLTQHMFVAPVPPSQVTAAARDLGALEEITLVCLGKRAEDRYPSMDRLALEVDRALRARSDAAAGGAAPAFRGTRHAAFGFGSGGAAASTAFAAIRGGSRREEKHPDRTRHGADATEPVLLPKHRVPWRWIVCGSVVAALVAFAWTRIVREAAHPTVADDAAQTARARDAARTTDAPHATLPKEREVSIPPSPPAIVPFAPAASASVIPTSPPLRSAATGAIRSQVQSTLGAAQGSGAAARPTSNSVRRTPSQAAAIDDVGDPFPTRR